MNRRDMLVRTGALALGLGLAKLPIVRADEGAKKKILFFTKSSGFEHSVIKVTGDKPSHAQKILTEVGAKHGYEITHSKDGSLFTPDYLAKFDAYFFVTTGKLTEAGTDKNPPMTAEGKTAFLDAIKNGKGFIGSHCASDTFHAGKEVDPYIAMLGGEFISHGAQQKSKMICADPKFPGFSELKDGVELVEEWYSLKNHPKDLHVLLTQETAGMQGWMYTRPQYPATWARMEGKGRVFYTSMGHREDVWSNPTFQNILVGALSWVTGQVEADVTPNIETVTPKYAETPQPPPPQPKK